MAKESKNKIRHDASSRIPYGPSRQELLFRLLAHEAQAAADEIAATRAGEFWSQGSTVLKRKLSANLSNVDEVLDELETQVHRINRLIAGAMQYRCELASEPPPVWHDVFREGDPGWIDVRTAAERFGLDRTTVRKHVKKYGIGERCRGRCYVSIKRARIFYSTGRFVRR